MFFRNFGYKAPEIELWSLNVTFAFTKPQGSRASTYTEGANAPKPRMAFQSCSVIYRRNDGMEQEQKIIPQSFVG